MQQEAFVQGINVPDPPGMVRAFNPQNLSSFRYLRGFLLQWLASEESLCCFSFASQTQQPNYAQRPILCL